MAEDFAPGSSPQITHENKNSQRAIELLNEATMLLVSSNTDSPTSTSTAATPSTMPSTTSPSTTLPSSTPPSTTPPSTLQHLRTIFSPYARTRISPASAYQRAQRPKTISYKPYYAVKETWTHEFFCLSEKNQTNVPSRSEKIQLQNCGLGRKKLCLPSKADHSKLEEKLLEVYPKLSEAGGFQILRTGSRGHSSSLTVIQPPPTGYSVPFLRDSSGLGQALAYIRPLQRNLSKIFNQAEEINLDGDDVLKIECVDCKAKVPVLKWAQHSQECPGGPSSTVDFSTSPMQPQVFAKTFSDSGSNVLQVTDEPGTSKAITEVKKLEDLFPNIRKELITKLYNASNGDLSLAASQLADLKDVEEVLGSDEDDEIFITDNLNEGDSLESYLSRVVKERRHKLISVNRKSTTFLADQVKLHKRGLEICHKPDVEFIGEEGMDASGPTKEYFHLTMQTLMSGDLRISMFEGKPDHLLPLHSTEAVESNLFFYAGRMIAHSFLHQGFPFVGMAMPVVTYIITGSIEEGIPQITFDDLPDLIIKDTLHRVMTADKEELEMLTMSDEVMNLLLTSGFVNKLLTLENRQKAVQDILIFYVLKMRIAELNDIRRGMNSVGLATFLKENPIHISKAFSYQKEINVVPDDLLKKIKLKSDLKELSEEENKSLCWFKRYINEVLKDSQTDSPHQATLEKLVQFIYGDPLPPTKSLTVKFGKKGVKLPDVDSCTAIITLPTTQNNYEDYKKAFDSTLSIQATGYGRI
ncbi:uncharacterized protein LOC114529572 [Dendronephthya gigantea]|uniref:uncharacterized protein LOC114529572 n=1 Tax=Dendronephthya gigantea TaxID=151771 RepID=UPI00106ACB73|nr:uncharacterized protein LOC114529572 [Dendronephthya gigantea]